MVPHWSPTLFGAFKLNSFFAWVEVNRLNKIIDNPAQPPHRWFNDVCVVASKTEVFVMIVEMNMEPLEKHFD
ncbi:hypothetical protein V9T40_006124 [Parthenolecanium corni]|uniref:Uncharacterized protein n=1 Tax=Parthenolecanium corni TaxID=536013 RepID=A0AAN9Y995_9HEMI